MSQDHSHKKIISLHKNSLKAKYKHQLSDVLASMKHNKKDTWQVLD